MGFESSPKNPKAEKGFGLVKVGRAEIWALICRLPIPPLVAGLGGPLGEPFTTENFGAGGGWQSAREGKPEIGVTPGL